MKDAFGTPYANTTNIAAGDTVRVDDGFTCMKKWSTKEVKVDPEGELYIDCKCGGHYLNGQLHRKHYYVGIYKV